ncbi:aspartate ammonia-lyase [Erysipelothrix amsterdamensis]|uniref:Aspartate ammonia-lyase n=1 Tax=Erysipelothrix amsterdamensis TaxID=2929157 RepID=A0AAU9VIH9_9FIRM|nr:aspartate ammonia-lyase [Erysipelothrix sp. A18Y020d]CAH2761974.1 aspartate ammonia-lyase [Erysipelothrix sp. A18Y020d]
MNIVEASKKAVEENRFIARPLKDGRVLLKIKPTNTPACCIVIDTIENRSCIRWNPDLDDLTADDWVIVD